MNDINANERGRSAYGRGKTRQPMNDTRFVKLMYREVAGSDDVGRTVKAHYITEWKNGWNEAKTENTESVASKTAKKTKKKAKKKSKRKAKR